ncbi:hypothetical protein X738_30460 [Mesorhizobium sp. LNHC209A00]|nr:hypothetical protein X738_30460 [Mesorhizobium sp. LNHC209A00]
MFQMVIDEARSLVRQHNEIEAQADDLLRHSQDYQLLRQIPGIGPIEALTVIAEAGDLRRLGHHRQFLKFCGLDLSTQKSGEARPAFPTQAHDPFNSIPKHTDQGDLDPSNHSGELAGGVDEHY